MKKFLVLLIIVFEVCINAQPYIYYSAKEEHPSWGPLEKIVRYNLKTNCTEDFFLQQTSGKYASAVWDPSQKYLIIYLFREGYQLYDCSNFSNSWDLGIWGTQIEGTLYINERNTLYIFSDQYKSLSVFDFSSDSITSEIILGKAGYDNSLMEPELCAFLSSDNSKIYFYNIDLSDQEQVWTYSVETNQIISKRNLIELGHLNADGYDLRFGKKGKGIVASYPSYSNPNKDFYYRIYDFDNNTGSDFIYHNGLSEAYFANDGDLILIMNTFKDDSTLEYYHTGEGFIYNTKNAQLIERIHLPSKGKIYSFDAEQQNLYYVKDIESDNREIYLISFDSSVDEPNVKKLFPK